MRNKYILSIILIIIIAAGFIYYKSSRLSGLISNNNKLHIVASFYPMYFFASQIGGNKADVMNITPASAEPHDYEPTTLDIARITNSNMLVLNGGKLEAWGDKIKDQLIGTKVQIITAGDNLATKQLQEQGKNIQDPHVWQDPVLAKQEVMNIEKGYEKIDMQDKDYFQANAKKLIDSLDKIDADFKQGLSNCGKKDFVTSHAAFGYLAARYGINQAAISGVSPDQEPSSRKLAEIADLVKKEQLKVIFFESLVSPKLSQTIAQETGARTMVLDPIEGISDDNMKQGKNYLSLMRDNLAALQSALECKK